jgi:hypothetical protein
MSYCSYVAELVQSTGKVLEVVVSFSRLVVDDVVGFRYDLLVSEKSVGLGVLVFPEEFICSANWTI